MSDYIKREDALGTIDYIAGFAYGSPIQALMVARDMIDNLPSADVVKRKRGEWKHDIGDKWYCSCCFNMIYTEGSWEKPIKKFCDECGADMRKQTERNIDE